MRFPYINLKATKKVSYQQHALSVLTASFLLNSVVWAQNTNLGLQMFQRFVTGKEPVKEAVVYRKISLPSGKILNQDWFRFGYQGDSWYAQRLTPDTNDPAKLLPAAGNEICGASFTHLWVISDKNVHVANKSSASGSVPQTFGAFPYDFILRSLALGIPHVEIGDIQWDGLDFTTKVVSKRGPEGIPFSTNTLSGTLALGAGELPVTAEYSGTGSFPEAAVSYEYGSFPKGIPTVFETKLKEPNGAIYRYEFLTLTLGKDNLEETGGYVPQTFADVSLSRVATLWTNNLPYSLINNQTIPAFHTNNPKRTGSLILGILAATMMIFLARWYQRSKRQNNKKQNK